MNGPDKTVFSPAQRADLILLRIGVLRGRRTEFGLRDPWRRTLVLAPDRRVGPPTTEGPERRR